MAKQLEFDFDNAKKNAKTSVLGVTRASLGLLGKGCSLALRGLGQSIAYGHEVLDTIEDGYKEQRSKK